MNKKLYISFSLFFLCLLVQAEVRDSIPFDKAMELPDKVFFSRIYNNASTAIYRPDAFSNGAIVARYKYEDLKKLSFVQDGQNMSEYSLSAKGQTVKNNKVFWGKVGYREFRRDSVRWSDVYDYRNVGPYLVGSQLVHAPDQSKSKIGTSGGNTFGEEYSLEGGLSIQHGKWIFGGEAGYLAGHSYRKKDPRPLSTATDLHLQMSVSYGLLDNYQLGLSGELGLYREKVEIKAENENSLFYGFYLFKGFGQYQESDSFSEKHGTSFSADYEGLKYGGTLFFVPKNQTGFIGSVGLNYKYIEPTASRRAPSVYNTYSFLADLGWQNKNTSGLSFIKFSYDNTLGKGIEHIYTSVTVSSGISHLVPLYSAQFYSKKTSMTQLSLGHEKFIEKGVLWFVADAAVETYKERYAYPANKAQYEHLWASLELGGRFEISKVSTLIPKVKYQIRTRLSDPKLEISLSEAHLAVYNVAFEPNYQYMFTDLNNMQGELTYQHKMKNKASVYLRGEGAYTFNKKDSRYGVNFSIGVMY